MANKVYANGMEVACKQGKGKSVAAFPDVCFTPPQTPGTPTGIPIPYPNTGFAKDTTEGTTTVMISGQEIMLSDKSYLKKSIGNEAGCAPKKGIVTGVNEGKVYFVTWSMDVFVEGEGMVRHLDLTTHNDAYEPSNSPIWPFIDDMAPDYPEHPCKDDLEKAKGKCQKVLDENKNKEVGKITVNEREATVRSICSKGNEECKESLKCIMTPYGNNNCCDTRLMPRVLVEENISVDGAGKQKRAFSQAKLKSEVSKKNKELDNYEASENEILNTAVTSYLNRIQTGHHPLSVHMFLDTLQRNVKVNKKIVTNWPGYKEEEAPVICVTGSTKTKEHGQIHQDFDYVEDLFLKKKGTWTYEEAADAASESVYKTTGCNKECIREQLDAYHVYDIGAAEPVATKKYVRTPDGRIQMLMPDLRANSRGRPVGENEIENVSRLFDPPTAPTAPTGE